MQIRTYTPADCAEICKLFYDTVHTVNRKDYTDEELQAWAPDVPDESLWNASFLAHYTVVAEESGVILGFGDIDRTTGYLDRLYVHKDFQNRGVAAALCDVLESTCNSEVYTIETHSSITAKPFFARRGYRVIKAQQVERHGVLLQNFVMKKALISAKEKYNGEHL